jgi:hemolysin III
MIRSNHTITNKSIKVRPVQRQQGLGEEIANSISHGIGAALSIAGLVLLTVYAGRYGDAWRVVSFSIYGTTLCFLYLSSTLYHSFQNNKVKRFFKLMDHVSIYLLIAGTYTPVTLVCLRGPWGWTIFGIIWAMAIGGIAVKVFLINRYKVISVVLYLCMGWLIVIAAKPMLETVPAGLIVWLVIGGVCYSLGVIFYAVKKFRIFILSGIYLFWPAA